MEEEIIKAKFYIPSENKYKYLYELNNLQQSSQNMLDTDISSINKIITNSSFFIELSLW